MRFHPNFFWKNEHSHLKCIFYVHFGPCFSEKLFWVISLQKWDILVIFLKIPFFSEKWIKLNYFFLENAVLNIHHKHRGTCVYVFKKHAYSICVFLIFSKNKNRMNTHIEHAYMTWYAIKKCMTDRIRVYWAHISDVHILCIF